MSLEVFLAGWTAGMMTYMGLIMVFDSNKKQIRGHQTKTDPGPKPEGGSALQPKE